MRKINNAHWDFACWCSVVFLCRVIMFSSGLKLNQWQLKSVECPIKLSSWGEMTKSVFVSLFINTGSWSGPCPFFSSFVNPLYHLLSLPVGLGELKRGCTITQTWMCEVIWAVMAAGEKRGSRQGVIVLSLHLRTVCLYLCLMTVGTETWGCSLPNRSHSSLWNSHEN